MPRGQEISAYSTCSLFVKDSTRIGRSRVRLAGVDARLMACIFIIYESGRGLPGWGHAASLREVRLPTDPTIAVCSITPKSGSQWVHRDAPRLLRGGAA